MSQIIPSPIDCCNDCPTPAVVNIPGANGANGAAGAAGANGVSAFTTVANYNPSAQPVMPAEGGTIVVNTTSATAFLAVGEPAFVENWGILKVTVLGSNTVTLQNLRNTASNLYPQNAAPGTSLAAASKIVGSGFNGANGSVSAGSAPAVASYITRADETGTLPNSTPMAPLATGLVKNTTATGTPTIAADGTDYISPTTGLTKAGNLAGLVNAGTSRTNLGLGSAAVKDSGVANGNLPPIDTTFTNGNALFATASGVQSKSPASARTSLGIVNGYGLLGALISQSTAATGDFTIVIPFSKYRIDKIVLSNPNISLGTAQFAVYTGAAGTGTTIAAVQSVGGLSAASKFIDLTLQAVAGTDYFTTTPLYIRITTLQANGTCDVHVFGWDLS